MDYPGKVITKNQVTPTQTSATGVWTLDDAAAATRNNNWPVAGVPNPISKSLRFNSADSAYLNRTPAGSGTLGVWTFSFWVKRAALGVTQTVFFSGTTNQRGGIRFTSGDLINCQPFNSTGANASWTSTAVFRDPSAWYHVVIRAFSSATGNSFGGVELALYINGVQQTFTLSTTGTPTGGDRINDSQVKQIGQITPNGDGDYLSAYLTEFNFIDGQALTPSSFGMTDPITGVWEPLKYSGTYGTNGFYLNFKDATSTTTLGLDYSGNSNTWTTNNFSVTAGAGNDSLTDVPTPWIVYNTTGDVGGVVRGNYATWNPLDRTAATYTNGNLEVTSTSSAAPYNMQTTIQLPTSGKWYCEVTALKGANSPAIGIGNNRPTDQFAMYRSPGSYITSGISGISSSGTPASWTTGDIIGIAYDAGAGTLSFYKNGTAQSGGFTSIPATGYFIAVRADSASGDGGTLNAGQRPFAYTPPSGFLSLCTTNLPASNVLKGNQYFDAKTWSGNSSTQSVSLEFAPGLIWNKSRSAASGHSWWDVIRGTGAQISSSETDAESTGYNAITSFGSNAISLGADNTGTYNGRTNETGRTYVGWVWNAGSSTVTNTSGTISSQVRANTTSGFSVVTWAGNSTNAATIGHGLGVAPSILITKSRTNASSWVFGIGGISGFGVNDYLVLQSTAAKGTSSTFYQAYGSSTFTVGVSAADEMNKTGNNYVTYCFAPISGFSAFGSYTGNGSADGPFVYLGFRPRFVMIKESSGTSNWSILDTSRDDYNVADNSLLANSSGAETTSTSTSGAFADILSNGFKLRGNSGDVNDSGATYIYACFAENPFKNALAR
jgi:hypothetical protein